MSAMALAYLSILPRTIIGFLTDETTYFTNIILFTYNTGETEDNICFFLKNKTGDNTKNTKRLTDWNTSFNKKVHQKSF